MILNSEKNKNTKQNTLLGDLYFPQLKIKRSDFFLLFFFILKYSKLHVDLICFTLDNKLLTKPTFLVTGVGPCDCWQRGSVFYRKEEIVQIFGDSQYANECTDNQQPVSCEQYFKLEKEVSAAKKNEKNCNIQLSICGPIPFVSVCHQFWQSLRCLEFTFYTTCRVL